MLKSLHPIQRIGTILTINISNHPKHWGPQVKETYLHWVMMSMQFFLTWVYWSRVIPTLKQYLLSEINTGATCTAPDGSTQTRYVYINNLSSGSIPFMQGVQLKKLKGLVPGALEDMSYVNPIKLFTAFSKGTDCQQITMDTRDIDNNTRTDESEYVLNDDIADYNPCWFQGGVNPVTKRSCIEAMTLPRDPSVQLYATCIGIMGIYILFCLLRKK